MTAVMMVLCVAAFAQDGKSIYNKYSDKENVSAVYISPSMFKLIGNLPDISMPDEDVNLTPYIKELKGMYLIDSENASINSALLADAEKMVKSGKYELLMEAKDSGEIARIYVVTSADMVQSFVMIASEPGECTVICIDGKIAKADVETPGFCYGIGIFT